MKRHTTAAFVLLLALCATLCSTVWATEKPLTGEANGQRFQVALPDLPEIQRCVQEFLDPFGNEGGPELHQVMTKVLFTIPAPTSDSSGKLRAPLQPMMFHYQLPAGAETFNFVQPYKEKAKQAIILFKGSGAFCGPDVYPVLLVFTKLPDETSETDLIRLRVNGVISKYRVSCAVLEKKAPPNERSERPKDAS
jgi:hypothetical protein